MQCVRVYELCVSCVNILYIYNRYAFCLICVYRLVCCMCRVCLWCLFLGCVWSSRDLSLNGMLRVVGWVMVGCYFSFVFFFCVVALPRHRSGSIDPVRRGGGKVFFSFWFFATQVLLPPHTNHMCQRCFVHCRRWRESMCDLCVLSSVCFVCWVLVL